VGIGDFGDAGGSNLERFRNEGLYAKAETDGKGRFVLEGVAVGRSHPLVVTHPEFVRYDGLLEVPKDRPKVQAPPIRLKPASQVAVRVVKADGTAVGGRCVIRLEALDGHLFLPPTTNPHLSAFASSTWMARAREGHFVFGTLEAGAYRIDVLRFAPDRVEYYGGLDAVQLASGKTAEAQVKPSHFGTAVTVRVPASPSGEQHMRPFLAISRNPGVLLWDDGKFHSLEDDRLGRIQKTSLVALPVSAMAAFPVQNLPPGTYAFWVGPPVCLRGAKVEIVQGKTTRVEIPWSMPGPEQIARVKLFALDKRVKPDQHTYTAEALCAFLTAAAEPWVKFRAGPGIRQELVRLEKTEMTLWDVLERTCLEKGWIAQEEGQDTLVLHKPGKQAGE